jgi:hypothetical protein
MKQRLPNVHPGEILLEEFLREGRQALHPLSLLGQSMGPGLTPLPPTPGRSGGPVQKGPSMRSARIVPLLLILLALALAASPAFAAGGRSHQTDRAPGLFATVWQALGELVPWLGATRAGKSGSIMDPKGQTTSTCPNESGSMMDPNGCPRSQSGSESGSMMDPDG